MNLSKIMFIVVAVAFILDQLGEKKLANIFLNRNVGNKARSRRNVPFDYPRHIKEDSQKIKNLFLETENKSDNSNEERIKECFQKWGGIQKKSCEEKKADIILSGYYANEKIRSKLVDFCEYVENDLEDEEGTESIVVCGFNTCMNFAWLDYEKMKAEKEKVPIYSPQPDENNVLAFLQDMSYMGGILEELYKAETFALDRIRGENIPVEDRELYHLQHNAVDKIESPEEIALLSDVLADLETRMEKQKQKISESSDLERALDSLMAEDDLSEMRNRELDVEKMKKLYHDMYEKAKDLISEFNR